MKKIISVLLAVMMLTSCFALAFSVSANPISVAAVAITGFQRPFVGDYASSCGANLQVSEGFSIKRIDYQKPNGEIMDTDFQFTSANGKYGMRVILAKVDGYVYADEITATVNGGAAEIEETQGGGYVVKYKFRALAVGTIINAAITGFRAPHVGDYASSCGANLQVSEGFSIKRIDYQKPNGEIMDTDFQFTSANGRYGMRVILDKVAGSVYADELTATVNGEAAEIEETQGGGYVVKFKFKATIPSYTVALSAEPAEGGTVTGGGTYPVDTNINITATPNEGYEFIGWYDGDVCASTEATIQNAVVDKDCTFTAKFKKIDTQPEKPASGKVCKYCGEVHEGFLGKIVGFFHSILALFGLKK